MVREVMRGVNSVRRCELCRGKDGCSFGDGDDLAFCRREHGHVPGWTNHGRAAGDPQWTVYRREGTHRSDAANRPPAAHTHGPACHHNAPTEPAAPPKSKPPIDWHRAAQWLIPNFNAERRAVLAAALCLPAEALDVFPWIGWDGDHWTLPEFDGSPAAPRCIGLSHRYAAGSKSQAPGGRRGLVRLAGWRERPGPVFIVEGHSDAIAATYAGLAVIGRPSNTGGLDHLVPLLAAVPADRQIIVVGEWDARPPSAVHPDGLWPGRDGAILAAEALARRLARPVGWAMAPGDGAAKDVRAWLTDPGHVDAWTARGDELREALLAAAESIAPPADATPYVPPDAAAEQFLDSISQPLPDQAAADLAADLAAERQSAAAVHADLARAHAADRPPPKTCGYWVTCYSEARGQFRACDVDCSCWNCLKCSKQHKAIWTAHLDTVMRTTRDGSTRTRPMFVGRVNLDDVRARARIRQQLHRANASHVQVKAADLLTALICATVAFDGATETEAPEAVATVLDTINAIPIYGDSKKPISVSADWQLPKEEPSDWERVGGLRSDTPRAKIVEAFREEESASHQIDNVIPHRVKRPFFRWAVTCRLKLDATRLEAEGPWPQIRELQRRLESRVLGVPPLMPGENPIPW